jgi:ribosomal protein S4
MKSHLRRLKFVTPKIFGSLRANYLVNRRNRRKKLLLPTSSFFSKIELVKDKNYYCFNSLSQIRRFLKRLQFSRRPDPIFLGLEGCFLNLVFKANLFKTTREARAFIKLGAFNVNGTVLKNPYRVLAVYDVFSAHPSFFKVI